MKVGHKVVIYPLKVKERKQMERELRRPSKVHTLDQSVCIVVGIRGVISGAINSQYLLEKSRIVFQVCCFLPI